MIDYYTNYPIKFVAPFRVSIWREYYDFHELAETARCKYLPDRQKRGKEMSELKAEIAAAMRDGVIITGAMLGITICVVFCVIAII